MRRCSALPYDRALVDFAFGSEFGEVVPGDVSDDLDDQPGCQRGVGVVEFGWEVLDAACSGVLDDAWPDCLAEAAEGFVDQVVVNRPVGDGLRLDVRPCLRIARSLAGEQVVERAGGGVALGERIAEAPCLPQSRDQ